ncbi:endoplasmic reticulum-Golgi intermediate compartment protein 3-like [Hibiscus syriacus]|uniref:Endoplasmic reticulum-Golgi intermediate compartment protein 3-like n=1 Tax=Hibiscus syriacus TaxID=106335 RepID=A0A6A2Y2Q2_HIBSY|nr:endoplasmic reticulum-Golgi intermediate compartment protein 3-like [Hibiscus syriacus]
MSRGEYIVVFHKLKRFKGYDFRQGDDKAPGPDGYTPLFFKAAWIQEYRHISCCSVVYKTITRILVERLAVYFPNMILPSQSAFVKGRSIVDNTLLAQEFVVGYVRKSISARCALKVDHQKAFDSCKKIGLTHLCFADDLKIFSKGSADSITGIQSVLGRFFEMSGLWLNPSKCDLFSAGVDVGVDVGELQDMQRILGFRPGVPPIRYLDVPLVTRKLMELDCQPLIRSISSILKVSILLTHGLSLLAKEGSLWVAWVKAYVFNEKDLWSAELKQSTSWSLRKIFSRSFEWLATKDRLLRMGMVVCARVLQLCCQNKMDRSWDSELEWAVSTLKARRFGIRIIPDVEISTIFSPRGSEPLAEEAVRLICETGGLAVLAHPWALKNPIPIIRRLKDVGRHGMEVYRSDGRLAAFNDLSDTYELLKLGGSDYHGRGGNGKSELGSVNLPVLVLHEFLKDRKIIQDEQFLKGTSSLSCGKDWIDRCLLSWLTTEERQNAEFEAIKLKLSLASIDLGGVQVLIETN